MEEKDNGLSKSPSFQVENKVDLTTHSLLLSPGPTEIPRELLLSLIKDVRNPDLDPYFYDFYHGIHSKLTRILNSWGYKTIIMLGEAMLGLEASIINLLKENELGIVLSNGFFGEGFYNLFRLVGRKGEKCIWDEREPIPPDEVESCLSEYPEAKAVYMIHCETPTGIMNPIESIGPKINKFGKMLIVDAVSSLLTVPIKGEEYGIDVLIAGSQKALNLPPGLTINLISEKAWNASIENNPKTFYLSYSIWKDFIEKREEMPPYTHSINMLSGLDEALNRFIVESEENVYKRHEKIREASWAAALSLGLEPFPKEMRYSCPGLTALLMPKGISSIEAFNWIRNKYGITLGIGLGKLKDKILRIGHMGYTASIDFLLLTYFAIGNYLIEKGNVKYSDVSQAMEMIMKKSNI
ncbi:MAG: alanine--glyoxylate aminotransferase family protein [Desulfurococcales archaeon]